MRPFPRRWRVPLRRPDARLAAGTLGLGPGASGNLCRMADALLRGAGRHRGRGAVLGHHQPGRGQLGADIAAVFLFLAGLPLLTGASIAGVLRATGRLADTTRTLARSSAELRPQRPATFSRRRARPTAAARSPRPRAGHPCDPRRGAVAGRPGTFPRDLRGQAIPDPDAQQIAASRRSTSRTCRARVSRVPTPLRREAEPVEPPDPSALTPRGRLRASVTDDPAFEWHVPEARC